VFVDAVLIATIEKSPAFTFGANYYFAIDVSNIVQNQCAPKAQNITSVFDPVLNQPVNISNTDCHASIGLIVTYFYRDPVTNILTNLGITDTIPFNYEAVIATRQTRETMDLDAYVMQGGTGAGLFLTNHTLPYKICASENMFLTSIPYLSNGFEVVTFDSAGATLDTGIAAITPPSDYTPLTIGVGLPNLATQTYVNGSVNTADPAIAGWIITMGNWYNFGGSYLFIAASEPHVFNLVECCGDSVRLHFLNRLGGADAYTFKARRKISEKTKSDIAQKPLSWGYSLPPNLIQDKGRFKIQNETVRTYELESTFYDASDGAWIAELLSSPEVYMETPDGLISVVVEDGSITTDESREFSKVTVVVTEANNISTQQN
jgi:hypothetical protein